MAKSRYLISPLNQEFKTSGRNGPAYEDPKGLMAAEKFARSILEQATDAIIVCDVDNRISEASGAAERLLNSSLDGKLLADAVPLDVAELAQAQPVDATKSSDSVLNLVLQQRAPYGRPRRLDWAR
jgi:PAS domain-containing protein